MAEKQNNPSVVTIPPTGTVRIGPATVSLVDPDAGPVALLVSHPFVRFGEPNFRTSYRRPTTGDEATEQLVLALASVWSTHVTRITILNQARFSAIHARLVDGYDPAAMRQAVMEYGQSEWHQKKKAWVDIAAFFKPEKLDAWLRKATERQLERTNRQAAKPPPNHQARKLVQDVAASAEIRSQEKVLLDEFAGMPDAQRAGLLAQAVEEVVSLRPSLRSKAKPSLDSFSTRMQLIVILKRRNAP